MRIWWSLQALGLLVFAGAVAAAERPNMVFILADDLGYGDLGCYGQKRIRTPNIDRLAAEGSRFTQFYAGCTVCAPSRSCLMTGQHTGHTIIRGNGGAKGERVALRPEEVTVARVLKKAGYATGIVGKWGLGEEGSTGVPNKQGFNYWFGFLNQTHAHNYYPAYLHRNEQKITIEGNEKNGRKEYAPDLITREALDFIDREKAGPFFLCVTYTLPHANNELGKKTGNGMEVPSDEPYSEQDWPQVEKNFAAMITRLDGDVGKIMAKLKELGLNEKTIVFFTSDNGPHKEGGHSAKFFNSSGAVRGTKRDLAEGGIRVPMIARWPGHVPAGRASKQVWAFWDVLPTVAELGEATAPVDIDGLSMVNALTGRPQKNHGFLYWEFHEGGFSQAARVENWKAIKAKGKPIALYDLATDVGETHDVAGEHADVVARMESILRNARSESKYWPTQ